MKRFISLFLIAVMLVMSLSVSAFATNQEVDTSEATLNRLQAAIDSYSSAKKPSVTTDATENLDVTISSPTLSINPSQITDEFLATIDSMSDEELAIYIENLYRDLEENMSKIEVRQDPPTAAPVQSRTLWGQDRYGDVWCGIPNIGWGYIRISYNVKWYDDDRGFSSADYKDSWQTSGFTIGTWSSHGGDATVINSSLVEVTTEGTITYPFGDFSATHETSFKYSDECPYEI